MAHQELSPEDVLRMTERKDKLQEQLEAAGEAKSMAARKTWEAEMSLREKIMALDASCGTYNTLAEELKLAPHTAKFARGKNLRYARPHECVVRFLNSFHTCHKSPI